MIGFMSNKGRPPKPIEQKRLLGNPGKRALPAEAEVYYLPQVLETPDPIRPLGTHGKELWNRVWSMGMSWISPISDIDLLMMTCEMLDERTGLRTQVFRDNRNEDRRALRHLESQIVSNLSLLGFSPTDRSRLGIAEVKKQSKLEELRARQKNND
jgi:hypothetical protein